MSWASMICSLCYIAVVVSSMADPSDISWKLYTWTQPFHVLTDARNHDVHVNDSRPQGIISCLEQAWFVVYATSPSLSRRWQTHQIFFESFIFELRRFTSFQTLESWRSCQRPTTTRHHIMSWASMICCPCYIAAVVSSMADPLDFFLKASYLNLDVSRPFRRSKSWCSCRRPTTTRHHSMSWASTIWCPCYIAAVVSSMADPLYFFLKASYLNSAVSRPYKRSKSWGSCQRSTTTRHHIMSWASMIWCPCYIAVVVSSMADPSDFSLTSFIFELRRFTSFQTLKIMTFMSTIHDHKTSYHVLSKHGLVPMLHHCRCLVDGRPFRFFLTASYLNSAVSRPYRRSKSWRSCQRFTTTRHHIMSRASMICCSCYIAVVISSMADPSDISWKLYTTPMTFHIL